MKKNLSVIRVFCLPLVCMMLVLSGCSGNAGEEGVIDLYAAASTQQVVEEVAELFTQKHAVTVRINSASSSTLARQIDAGAKADIYLSANEQWMNFLEDAGRLVPNSRSNLLGNQLALISSLDQPFERRGEIRDMLSGYKGRLSLGDPSHVPAGIYAKAALESLGLWGDLESQVVAGSNVRAALNFVATGEAQLGIVYSTDVLITEKVVLLGAFPENISPPIRYPVALIKGASTQAEVFLKFLHTEEAAAIFEKTGFITTEIQQP